LTRERGAKGKKGKNEKGKSGRGGAEDVGKVKKTNYFSEEGKERGRGKGEGKGRRPWAGRGRALGLSTFVRSVGKKNVTVGRKKKSHKRTHRARERRERREGKEKERKNRIRSNVEREQVAAESFLQGEGLPFKGNK